MESCICCSCAKIINQGNKVYWVEKSKSKILAPACSMKCAESFRIFVINELNKKLESVKKQIIEEDIL